MEAKMKGQAWKYFVTANMPSLDQLLQTSPVTIATNSTYARPHLRAITASKSTMVDLAMQEVFVIGE
jgi:hypothetical protein